MAEGWSRSGVEATVADYFAMWAAELAHRPVNKAEHNRALQALLNNRSKSAVEFKHQNISAVLIELGLPYIDGYKPMSNYQDLLREVVVARLSADPSVEVAAATAVAAPAQTIPAPLDWSSVVVPAPEPDPNRKVYDRPLPGQRILLGTNYLEREARNASLGNAGEGFVLQLEHARLWQNGKKQLAEKIEHVSRSRGDGLGYDILSFEDDGRERLIEVKTTRFGVMTPFFASKNEVSFSEAAGMRFHLYRVFKFDEAPKVFVLKGALAASVRLDPVSFRASVR
jgi:hypothetical protein